MQRKAATAAAAVLLAAAVVLCGAALSAEAVPCLQREWDQTTGACYILNKCAFNLWADVLCDRDVLVCGTDEWQASNGTVFCPNSRWYIGTCKIQCQGLEWNNTAITHCLTNNNDPKYCSSAAAPRAELAAPTAAHVAPAELTRAKPRRQLERFVPVDPPVDPAEAEMEMTILPYYGDANVDVEAGFDATVNVRLA